MENVKVKMHLQYNFNNDEKLELSQELALANQEKNKIEDAKKSANSDFKARLDNQQSTINIIADKVANGYEHRSIECEVQFHTPKNNKKTITRTDNGETWVELMSQNDHNLFNQPNELD